MATPPGVVERIGELARPRPAYGCNKIEALLALEGKRAAAITIPKILTDKGLGTRRERWLALERQNAHAAIELSPEQAAFLEKLNPCFKERHVESGRPGELLSQGTFLVGTLKGVGRVPLHAAVDPFGSPTPSAFRAPPSSPRPRWRCRTAARRRSTASSTCRCKRS